MSMFAGKHQASTAAGKWIEYDTSVRCRCADGYFYEFFGETSFVCMIAVIASDWRHLPSIERGQDRAGICHTTDNVLVEVVPALLNKVEHIFVRYRATISYLVRNWIRFHPYVIVADDPAL